jgi:hypothetical protein
VPLLGSIRRHSQSCRRTRPEKNALGFHPGHCPSWARSEGRASGRRTSPKQTGRRCLPANFPSWARTRTLLIQRGQCNRSTPPTCHLHASSWHPLLEFAGSDAGLCCGLPARMSTFADPVDCRRKLGRGRYRAERGEDATLRRFLIRSQSGPQPRDWGESARRANADADVAPRSGSVTSSRRMSSPCCS